MRRASVVVASVAAGLVVVGSGTGLAWASSGSVGPAAPAAVSQAVDTPEPGDTPDPPGHTDAPGQPDVPEPGDTPDPPGQG